MRRRDAHGGRAHRQGDGHRGVRRREPGSHGGHLPVRRTYLPRAERGGEPARSGAAPARRTEREHRGARVPQPARVHRGLRGRLARRLPSHADQLAPHRGGGRLHRRRQRGGRAHRRRLLRRQVGRHRQAARGSPVLLALAGDIDGFASYEEALDAEDAADIADPEPGGAMLYTSGTTGRPKGVRRGMGLAPALYRLQRATHRTPARRIAHSSPGPCTTPRPCRSR